MKNKIFFILIVIFSILNLADLITSFFILPGESNPLFIFVGKWLIIALKVVLIFILIWIYNNNVFNTQFTYFNLLTILTLGCFLLCIGIYSNIMGILNPAILEYAASMSNTEKIKSYGIMVFIFGCLPFIINLITFKLWEKSKDNITLKIK